MESNGRITLRAPALDAGRRTVPRRTILRGAALLGVPTGMGALAGCSGSTATGSAATAAPASATPPSASPTQVAAAAKPKYGGTFRIASSEEVAHLDPHQNVSTTLSVTGPAIAYSKLVQFKVDSSVKPSERIPTGDLAESWQQVDDTTYVFKLRPNAKWQNIAPVNGRPVVAEDVKYSFERQLALKTNAAVLGGLVKVDAVDAQTVRVTLAKPDADFLVTFADTRNKIVPHEVVEQKGDLKEGPVIGSGPWVVDQYQNTSGTIFRRNPDYYFKGLPYVDRLEIPVVRDPATRDSAFRAKQLDALRQLTAQDAEALARFSPDVAREAFKAPQGIYVSLNTTKPPFNDIRVRQAIFKAINKQQIMDFEFNGQAWYYPGVRMATEDQYLPDDEVRAIYKQDVAGAKRLLSEAGVPAGAAFELTVTNLGAYYVDTAQLVKSDLASVGIDLTIKTVDIAGYVANVYQNATFEMAVSTTSPNSSTNAELFSVHHTGGARSASKLSDPKLDALIEQQAVMVRDPEGRKKLLKDLQRYILNSAHQIYLAGQFVQGIRWNYLKDFFPGYFDTGLEENYVLLWLEK
jgi:peptide/nickel transport system substrate-binding protein